MNVLAIIFFIIGIFSLVYLAAIISYAGSGTAFLWFWITAGIVSILFSIVLLYLYSHKIVVGKYIKVGFTLILLLGVFTFLLVEGNIISKGRHQPDPGADYVIILGAQVRGTALSKALKNRLDTAYDYLMDNEGTIVIVSGGQGSGEDISEAEAMSQYLISRGIQKARIIKEDQSTNTNENINFSKELMTTGNHYVVLVTNQFHVYRSTSIAKKQGLSSVQGLGAPTDDILMLSYYVREFFAVLKDKLAGNI